MTETVTEATTERAPLAIGQRFRVNRLNPEGAILAVGDTVECVEVTAAGTGRYCKVNDQDTLDERRWIIYPASLDPLFITVTMADAFVPNVVERAEHDRIVASLQEQVAEATRRADEAEAQQRAETQTHRSFRDSVYSDVSIIGEVFTAAAERNDLCGVYDETVSAANSRTSVVTLPEREVDYEVSWQETYTVTVTRTSTFTGIRGDDDGNSERAESERDNSEALNEYDLIQALRDNGAHEFDDYVDDSLEWETS